MSKDPPDLAGPIEGEREDDETPSPPVDADDPESVDTTAEMMVGEIIEAEVDPAHPRHEEAIEANRQMSERYKGLYSLSPSIMESLTKMVEAIAKGSGFDKINKAIFANPPSSLVIPQERLSGPTPMGPTILQRQLAATDQVIQQLTELVRLTKTDADAQAEARKDARSTRHGLLIGWLGVILAALAVVVGAIVGS